MDLPLVQENAAALQRLRSLLDRLSDAQLAQPLFDGWTIAGILAHGAFWDRRALILIQHWEQDGSLKPSPYDADTINDAMKAHCVAIPSRDAANLALLSAEAIERKLANLDPDHLAALMVGDPPLNPVRATHWNKHISDIEQALERTH